MNTSDSFSQDDGLPTLSVDLTREQWRSRIIDAIASRGDALTRFPRACDPEDFLSFVVFLGQQWRSPSEAAEMLKAVADFIAQGDCVEASRMTETPMREGEAKGLSSTITDPTEWHADAQWALQQWEDRNFESVDHDYVAVYQKELRGTGNDPNELRRTWSEKFGVPFQRIIVKYVGKEE